MDLKLPDPLPEGWKFNALPGDVVVIEWPSRGAVSIGWKSRRWALGWTAYPQDHGGRNNYCGRDWRQRLQRDAVAALKQAWDEK